MGGKCLEETYQRMQMVFESVPMGRTAREGVYGTCPGGNPVLGGYDCVIWTCDALRALIGEGLIDLGGRGVGMGTWIFFVLTSLGVDICKG